MNEFFKKVDIRLVLVATLTFFLGWQLGQKNLQNQAIINSQVPAGINVNFKLFWDTWNLLSTTYYDKSKLDPQKMFYGAISGMVASIGDPYTVFLPPQQQKATQEELSGSFEGVGLELGFNEATGSSEPRGLAVISPLSGTPAEKAGIKPQDLIVKINDKDAINLSLPDAVNLIRGPKGTAVSLTILRPGETDTRVFKLTRETIIVKSVEVSYRQTDNGKNIALIKLSRFGERTEDEWKQAVDDIVTKNPDGIILDVRNNPGGYLEAAVFIGSEFLDGGNVVLQQDNKGNKTPFKVSRVGRILKTPLVVLINKGSASASEIVAGALQDRGRAKLVGEQSFGKGTIQEAEDLSYGTGIHITVAKWLTPNGHWVNATHGLTPDVAVAAGENAQDKTDDPQLNKALELLQ